MPKRCRDQTTRRHRRTPTRVPDGGASLPQSLPQNHRLVATDGRRLACAPADVPAAPFILPNQAVAVLAHPGYIGSDVYIQKQKVDDTEWISIRSGNHVLMSKTIEGNYPNYRQVIPQQAGELVTFSPDHRASVIKWLRGLADNQSAVNLS